MTKFFQKIYHNPIFIGVICLSVGMGIGWGGSFFLEKNNGYGTEVRELTRAGHTNSNFPLTNPLLECSEIENLSNKTTNSIKEDVSNFLRKRMESKDIIYSAVYFRDLNNGPWFGLNEKEDFIPGSLLKVPFMMSIFKQTESEPKFLLNKVDYAGGRSAEEQYYKFGDNLKEGNIYSIFDLVQKMIKNSDNDATILLSELVDRKLIERVYDELGIAEPKDSKYTVSVRGYGSFFRILFNASYLGRALSEQALELLADSNFNDGLRAGVPEGIVVAHKFGERSDETKVKQLHDCGIIYYPDYPYLLCVMTKGSEFPEMADTIKGISKIVYEGIENSMKK